MPDSSILTQVVAVVAESARVDPFGITPGTRLRDGLGISSLGMIDLVVAAEDRFGIRIPDDDAERFQTVGDLVAFLQQAKPVG